VPCYILTMIASSTSCIFCQIIDGSSESSEVYRDEDCVAFLDVHPINVGHALVCPTRHVNSFTDLKPGEIEAILGVAQQIARTQRNSLSACLGVNLLLSDGEVAGQEVPHAHFHVIPRGKDDGFGWRRFGKKATRKELDSIAVLLRAQ